MDNWYKAYVPAITQRILSEPGATEQLLRVTRAPIDPSNSATISETVLGLLWYSVFATNDGIDKLHGQPFDNTPRFYFGSANDWLLNQKVQRFDADQAALDEIKAHYQAFGRLKVPLVTLHTTGDPIVPYWHEPLYRVKVWSSGSALMYSNIPIVRYGHCNFKAGEVLAGFALMVLKVTGQELVNAYKALHDTAAQSEFLQLARQHGALH